jgi:hypothetical protein
MSRGPGKIQQFIMNVLEMSSAAVSTARLRKRYEFEAWDPDRDPDFDVWNTAARQRSVRMSMGRALRQFEAAGQIKRNKAGDWYPAKDWTARDNAERERSCTAYHEAGHAVIGLALRLPVAFVTIKPRAGSAGHFSQAPIHRGVGTVYARGSYRKPIAEISEQDAFGNPVSGRNDDRHADIVTSIAGGMAEAEFLKDGRNWRELEGTGGDRRNIAFYRRELGDKARGIEEYEAKCARLVKQYWPMIEAVAARLLKDETISGSDVYSICWRTFVRRQHIQRPKSASRLRDTRKVGR